MGSEFKMYTNALYDEDIDDDQPIFCQNVQGGSLHGVINPLFEEDMEVLDLVELDANGDTLSCYCDKSACSSLSICDSDSNLNVAFDDEVLDGVVFENQLAFHNKFYDDLCYMNTNQHFDCEDASESLGVISEADVDDMCVYKSDYSLDG